MPVYCYDPPGRFLAGAVGQPGERIFYLQATSSGRVTSVVLEKFQVSLLAERIDELLDEVLRRTGGSPEVPATAPASLQDDAPLDLPLLEDCRVTPRGTSARGRTVTAPAMLEPKRSAPDDEDGEQATLDLLASGTLEIEGRLVDASNATLYCTISPPGSPPVRGGPGGSGGTGSPSQGGSGGMGPPGKKSRGALGGIVPPGGGGGGGRGGGVAPPKGGPGGWVPRGRRAGGLWGGSSPRGNTGGVWG